MMQCLGCAATIEPDAIRCWSCGGVVAELGAGPMGTVVAPRAIEPRTSTSERRRPDGSTLIGRAWGAAGLGLLLFLFGALMSVEGEAYPDPDAMIIRWWLLVTAAGLLQLGLFLGVAGAIVRAIWFLPGDESKAPPSA